MAPVESRTTDPKPAPADPAPASASPADPSVSVIALPAPDPATGVPRPLAPDAPAPGAQPGAPGAAAQEPLPPVAITVPVVRTAAVNDLLREVRRRWAAGEHEQAAAGLERALRIEPTNPYLWQHLAAVRLDQGRPQQAEQFAAKSNSMAGDSAPLRLRNWRLIAEARRRAGNAAGAREAERRAAQYETAR
jgi:predicted Zn-dependent protease